MAYRLLADNKVSGDFNPFRQDSTAQWPLGDKKELQDGRVFRYCEMGASNVSTGKLLQSAVPEAANHLDMACNTAAIGDTTVTVTDGGTAFVANDYAGGLLYANDDTGEGRSYRIKSHPANAGSTTCVFTLEDPIDVAFAAGTTVTVVKNKYKDVIVFPTTASGVVVGVTPISVTANYFFWAQTKGLAPVLQHTGSSGAAAVGTLCVASSTNTPVAGAVEEWAAGLIPPVGTIAQINATTEYGLVDLKFIE